MTQTAEPGTTGTTADDTATAWLTAFEAALATATSAAAAALFATELLARPGLVHLEHHDGRGPRRRPDLLEHTLDATDPSGFALAEPADEADGVVTAWFRFETAVGRGPRPAPAGRRGRRARAFTFLTTLLRAQGPRGAAQRAPARWAPSTVRTSSAPRGRSGASRRPSPSADHPALRARDRRRPGRHRARLPAAAARRAQPGDRQAPAPRRPVAQPLQVAVPARPGLVRPPALPEVPRQLAGLLTQGQDRRLAGVLREDHGGAVLVEHHRHRRPLHRGDGEWTVEVEREGKPLTLRPTAAGARHRHVRQAEPARPARHGRLPRATSTTPPRTPARTRTPASSCVVVGSNNSRVRHLRGALGARRRRDHGAAVLDAHRARATR